MTTPAAARISAECLNGYWEICTDPRCEAAEHLPDRDWTEVDEDAAWLWDDDRARRRADVY